MSVGAQRAMPIVVAVLVVGAFSLIAPAVAEPDGPVLASVKDGTLTDAQAQTLDTVKELNAYLISLTTLMFGGLGWYLSQYRPATSPVLRGIFFTTAGFLALAFWYAAQTYSQTASELAQDSLGVKPGASRILFYVQLEFAACAIAAVLILLVFADAVTRARPQ